MPEQEVSYETITLRVPVRASDPPARMWDWTALVDAGDPVVVVDQSTDTSALDKIATYLGTREEWNGGDALEEIARIINTVRPSVDGDASAYAATFLTATGRQAPDSYIALD